MTVAPTIQRPERGLGALRCDVCHRSHDRAEPHDPSSIEWSASPMFDPLHAMSLALIEQRRADIERSYRPDEIPETDLLPGLQERFLAADQPVSSLIGSLEQHRDLATRWIERLTPTTDVVEPEGTTDAC